MQIETYFFFGISPFLCMKFGVGKSSADPVWSDIDIPIIHGLKIFFRGILSQKYASWNLGVRYRRFIQTTEPLSWPVFWGQPPPPPENEAEISYQTRGSIWVLGTYNTYVMVVPSHIGYVRGDHLGRWPKWDLNFYPRKMGYLVMNREAQNDWWFFGVKASTSILAH